MCCTITEAAFVCSSTEVHLTKGRSSEMGSHLFSMQRILGVCGYNDYGNIKQGSGQIIIMNNSE
jgi:hypothetical protein